MTDQKLLEMAAKAAGVQGHYRADFVPGIVEPVICGGDVPWNPLHKDGDALRLAVKLEMDLWFGCGGLSAHGLAMDIEEDYGRDRYAATRRAIVRAAAEIGKAMK